MTFLKRAAEIGAMISRNGIGFAGVALISYGAWLAWHPLGFVTLGAFFILGAWLLAKEA